MSPSGHEPFTADVHEFGGYQYTRGDRLSHVLANRRFSDMIAGAADFSGMNVADIGCGDGTFTLELARRTRAASIVGVDPSAPAIAVASAAAAAEPRVTFRLGTASDIAAEGRRFDIAVYRGVIHHVEQPALEIATAFRIAPLVIFLEPNGLNPVVKVIEKLSSYHRRHGERSYSPQRLRSWIEDGGGFVVSLDRFGLVPFFSPDWLASGARRLEPFVEKLPLIPALVCGQVLITARRR